MPKGDNDKSWESMYPSDPHPPLTEDDLRHAARRLLNPDRGPPFLWMPQVVGDAEMRDLKSAIEAAEQARLAWWC